MKFIKRVIYRIIRTLLWYMPKAPAHKILYYIHMKKKLNLKNPKDFNEKLQWKMVYEDPKKYARFADKLLVRDYIAEKGYSNILTKVYLGGGGKAI